MGKNPRKKKIVVEFSAHQESSFALLRAKSGKTSRRQIPAT
jgi:hypothetical protein